MLRNCSHCTDANRDYLRVWLPWLDRINVVADTQTSIESRIESFATDRGLTAAICDEDEIVGLVGYNRRIDRQNRIGYIGYWLAKNYQGKGIMKSSCRAIIDYGFKALNFNQFVIICAAENQAIRSIPERLDFSYEGAASQDECLGDRFVKHKIYALLDRDWGKIDTAKSSDKYYQNETRINVLQKN